MAVLRISSLAAAIGFLLVASSALAKDGDLDRTFGHRGKVMTDFGRSVDRANAVAVQADGKLVVVGSTYVGDFSSEDFALARYLSNGTMDKSFGTTGRVTTDFAGLAALASAVVMQPDGKIVVAGSAFPEFVFAGSIVVARYTIDGSLDGSFGTGGIVTTHCPNQGCSAASIALQGDRRIVVAGTEYVDFSNGASSNTDFAVVRYNGDGTLDEAFGLHGLVTTDFEGLNDDAAAVVIQPDGRIVAFGSATNFAADFAAARYLPNGSLDASFGAGGRMQVDLGAGGADQANAVALQPDGRFVAGGYVQSSDGFQQEFAVARFDADGGLDKSFHGDGVRAVDFGDCCQAIRQVLLPADGKIVAVGYPDTESSNSDFVLLRLTPEGDLDHGFGRGGKVRTSFGDLNGGAEGAALQPDGRIVAVGFQATPGTKGSQFALARYQGAH